MITQKHSIFAAVITIMVVVLVGSGSAYAKSHKVRNVVTGHATTNKAKASHNGQNKKPVHKGYNIKSKSKHHTVLKAPTKPIQKKSIKVAQKKPHIHKKVKYHATGTASYYGYEFNTRKTATGQRFNPLGMTAAHRTLPLPTKVKVTNLKNKKSVIVTVNDRGPYVKGRLIDLSLGAARKLGITGLERVDVVAIN